MYININYGLAARQSERRRRGRGTMNDQSVPTGDDDLTNDNKKKSTTVNTEKKRKKVATTTRR